MTQLVIDLAPEQYAQLQREARRQGKTEQLLATELLVGQLRGASLDMVPLYIQMMPSIQALAGTMQPTAFSVPGVVGSAAPTALMQTADDEDIADDQDDVAAWEDMLRAIDANRPSYRKLFPHLEQPT